MSVSAEKSNIHKLNQEDVENLAEIFDLLAQIDFENKRDNKPADKGHQVQINLALTKL